MHIDTHIDDELFKQAMYYSQATDKTEIIQKALHIFIETKRQETLQNQQKLKSLRGQLQWEDDK
jgi:hypothetical protein